MNLSVQFMTMAAMAVMGIWIGLSVDTYGRFFYRGPRRRWNVLQISGDLVFWLIQGLLVFLVLLSVNHGDVRIYIFIALLCGYAAYRSLFQSLYRRLLEFCIQAVLFVMRTLKQIFIYGLLRPVGWVLKLVWFSGKIMTKVILSILFFAWMVIWVPLRWLFRLILPETFLERLKKITTDFKKHAGFLKNMKNIKNKLKDWFGKKKK